MSKPNLLNMFEKQMRFERDTARSLHSTATKTRNTVPKLIFRGIELDTTKHAHMYATLIDLAAGKTISKVEHYEMRKAVERHLENEKKMLAQAEMIAGILDDARMKPLLDAILADERRHHEVLSTLLSTIAVEEKISEDDWWNYLNKWAVFST